MKNRYSPQPVEAYTYRNIGVGQWYKDKPENWNLIWLSCPVLDDYLDPVKAPTVMGRVDPKLMGIIDAGFRGDDEADFPNIHEICSLPIEDFKSAFLAGPWSYLPVYEKYGMEWLETVKRRSTVPGERAYAKGPIQKPKPSVTRIGNLIQVDFRAARCAA